MDNWISSAVAVTGWCGQVDELDNQGDNVVGLEGTPQGVLSPLVDPKMFILVPRRDVSCHLHCISRRCLTRCFLSRRFFTRRGVRPRRLQRGLQIILLIAQGIAPPISSNLISRCHCRRHRINPTLAVAIVLH